MAATFGASLDGLPAIGASSLMPHVWLAAGYGGNGIAFVSLAAEMLERALADMSRKSSGEPMRVRNGGKDRARLCCSDWMAENSISSLAGSRPTVPGHRRSLSRRPSPRPGPKTRRSN